MIITRTPVRVSLLGGGTDYPDWFRKHGGMVVGCAINKYSYVSVRRLPPFHPHRTRVVYSDVECVERHSEIRHRAVRACLEQVGLAGDEAPGLEIFHAADLPGRSGTGSSSTFCVGLINALSALGGMRYSPAELAKAAIEVEQVRLGETVGCQDQVWAAHGGLGVIKFRPDSQGGGFSFVPLTLGRSGVEALEAHLMLFFTGVQRTSSEVAASYAPSLGTRDKEQWAMMHFAEEGILAVQNEDFSRLGELIDLSWRVKASLAKGVSTEKISRLYTAARLSGALGGKITGAGGGGCLVLVVPPEKQLSVKAALQAEGAVHVPFRIDFDGSVVIFQDRHQEAA